jgi:hypothetical protein
VATHKQGSRARIAICRAVWRASDNGLAWLLVATLALSSLAIINGYPLVFSDTGPYISTAVWQDLGALDRPPYYSLFLLPLHLKMSLWPIPLAQNLIVCWVLFRFLACIFPNLPLRLRCSVIVLTGVVSYLPWASNEIMPDIYTPLILLLIFMLFLPIDHELTLPTKHMTRLEWLAMLSLLTVAQPDARHVIEIVSADRSANLCLHLHRDWSTGFVGLRCDSPADTVSCWIDFFACSRYRGWPRPSLPGQDLPDKTLLIV